MKLERVGKKLFLADMTYYEIADCNPLTAKAIEGIVQNNNFGEEVVKLYKEYRESCTVQEAMVFFSKIEQLYREHQQAMSFEKEAM